MKHIKNIYDFTGEGGQERLRKHIDNVKSDPEYKAKWIEHRDLEIKKWWLTLKPFKDESDVPNLPKMDDFFIQRLKELGAIEKSKLVDGQWYYGNYRSSNYGKWNSDKNEFEVIRYKFGYRWDSCNHFEDDDGYALFVPLRLATKEEALEEESKIEN